MSCKTCNTRCIEQGSDHDMCMAWTKKPKTNSDRIRTMSDEELAEVVHLTNDCCCDYVMNKRGCAFDKCGPECWLDWLKEEIDEQEI